MALEASTYAFLNQQGFLRLIDASTGPDGPTGVTAYWLVPANGWNSGNRFPHAVAVDLDAQKYDKRTVEGLEYFLVPEESTNLPGRLAHYAQATGQAELVNPSSGGINRVRETFVDNSASATWAPEAVAKYVEDNDSWEEARKKASEHDERVVRQVTESPAREPAEGKLVVGSGEPKAKPVNKAPKAAE